jgi:hypothetical protein
LPSPIQLPQPSGSNNQRGEYRELPMVHNDNISDTVDGADIFRA